MTNLKHNQIFLMEDLIVAVHQYAVELSSLDMLVCSYNSPTKGSVLDIVTSLEFPL